MSTLTPLDYIKMKKKERDDALASLMLLTEKRNGDIKVQGFSDRRKQQEVSTYRK